MTERSRIALGELGRSAVSLRMDVADAASIDAARRSIQKQLGAVETTVWLATLSDDGPTGGFFRDRRRIEW